MKKPPKWSEAKLQADRLRAIGAFRRERLQEPVAHYCAAVGEYREKFCTLMKNTCDLNDTDDDLLGKILADKDLLSAFRYLAGPPISEDDLKILADAKSLSPTCLRTQPKLVSKVARLVMDCIDRHRFPWVQDNRKPRKAEKDAAVLASAALMAYQRIQTSRRNEAKEHQEGRVADALREAGFTEASRRLIEVLSQAPGDGEFCAESMFSTRKADFIVGLWDGRKMPVECKVSNSELNSVKRLNNDAAAKAVVWLEDFGPKNVVPIAVLSGVYKLQNLVEAQDRGLTLFWAHALRKFINWCNSTRK